MRGEGEGWMGWGNSGNTPVETQRTEQPWSRPEIVNRGREDGRARAMERKEGGRGWGKEVVSEVVGRHLAG